MFTTRFRRQVTSIGAILLLSSIVVGPPAAFAARGDCGQPVTDGAIPRSSDCLYILRAAVDAVTCDPACICDPNNSSGTITSSDALLCLRVAVETPGVTLNCGETCGVVTTTTIGGGTTTTIGGGTTTTIGGGTTTTIGGGTTTTIGGGTTTTIGGGTTTTIGGGTTTTIGGVTTTTIGGGSTECPDSGVVTILAGTGRECASNADCPAGSCDEQLLRCVTRTELDTGYTGISHDADVTDGVVVRASLNCTGTGPACGECSVAGIDPSPGYCRCANSNRAVCYEPFGSDPTNCPPACKSGPTPGEPCSTNTDCGDDPGTPNDVEGECSTSDACNCYLGPPLSLSAGNTPACVVNRLAEDLSGTVNVDTGSAHSTVKLRAVVHTSENLAVPCPYCEGDVTANDGNRDGTCVTGLNNGAPCDVNAVNPSFPATASGGHSLDCFPDIGKNVSGQGLAIAFTQSTGPQQLSISGDVICGFPSIPSLRVPCWCLQCSGDSTVSCTTHAECENLGLGACNSTGGASLPAHINNCEEKLCSDAGGGEGVCTTGPDILTCDGITRANGEGFIECQNDDSCSEANIGIAAGKCASVKRQECFLPTIEAEGTPDPETPVAAGVFCIPPTASPAINNVAGLPGPGRLYNQSVAQYFCAGGGQYQVGVGCP